MCTVSKRMPAAAARKCSMAGKPSARICAVHDRLSLLRITQVRFQCDDAMHEGSCMWMAIKSCVGWLFVAPFLSGGPHLTGRSTGNAAPPYRWLQPTGMSTGYCMPVHHDFDGLYLAGMSTDYASPHPFRWGTPHRDVGGLCLGSPRDGRRWQHIGSK